MKAIFLPFAALAIFLILPVSQGHADQHAMAAKPKLYGVLAYADWCGSCKILDPAVKEARTKADLDNKDILFVTLDLTDDTTKKQSELLASSLGFGEFYKANDGKTGSFILIDAASGKEVARYKKDSDADAIAAGVTEKLAM